MKSCRLQDELILSPRLIKTSGCVCKMTFRSKLWFKTQNLHIHNRCTYISEAGVCVCVCARARACHLSCLLCHIASWQVQGSFAFLHSIFYLSQGNCLGGRKEGRKEGKKGRKERQKERKTYRKTEGKTDRKKEVKTEGMKDRQKEGKQERKKKERTHNYEDEAEREK